MDSVKLLVNIIVSGINVFILKIVGKNDVQNSVEYVLI